MKKTIAVFMLIFVLLAVQSCKSEKTSAKLLPVEEYTGEVQLLPFISVQYIEEPNISKAADSAEFIVEAQIKKLTYYLYDGSISEMNYPSNIYSAEIIHSYKGGLEKKDILYFYELSGPLAQEPIHVTEGRSYLLFLNKSSEEGTEIYKSSIGSIIVFPLNKMENTEYIVSSINNMFCSIPLVGGEEQIKLSIALGKPENSGLIAVRYEDVQNYLSEYIQSTATVE